LYTSDHRPVLALFEANIVTLDHDAKVKLQKELYQSLSSIEVRALPPPDLPKRKLTAPMATSKPIAVASSPIAVSSPPIAASAVSSKLSDSFVDTLIDISYDGNDCKSIFFLYKGNGLFNFFFFRIVPSPSSESKNWWDDGSGIIQTKL
jgi:hypothetical protein